MNEERLAEIEARAKAASDGPWRLDTELCDCGGDYPCYHGAYPTYVLSDGKESVKKTRYPDLYTHHTPAEIVDLMNANDSTLADGEFIAAARVDVPDLCQALREAWKAYNDQVQTVLALMRENVRLQEASS